MRSRPLLGDAHETHARFASEAGRSLTATKLATRSLKETRLGVRAGVEISLSPVEGFLQPFARVELTIRCRMNMPGRYRDAVTVVVRLSALVMTMACGLTAPVLGGRAAAAAGSAERGLCRQRGQLRAVRRRPERRALAAAADVPAAACRLGAHDAVTGACQPVTLWYVTCVLGFTWLR
jgi:hypothetical protein